MRWRACNRAVRRHAALQCHACSLLHCVQHRVHLTVLHRGVQAEAGEPNLDLDDVAGAPPVGQQQHCFPDSWKPVDRQPDPWAWHTWPTPT